MAEALVGRQVGLPHDGPIRLEVTADAVPHMPFGSLTPSPAHRCPVAFADVVDFQRQGCQMGVESMLIAPDGIVVFADLVPMETH